MFIPQSNQMEPLQLPISQEMCMLLKPNWELSSIIKKQGTSSCCYRYSPLGFLRHYRQLVNYHRWENVLNRSRIHKRPNFASKHLNVSDFCQCLPFSSRFTVSSSRGVLLLMPLRQGKSRFMYFCAYSASHRSKVPKFIPKAYFKSLYITSCFVECKLKSFFFDTFFLFSTLRRYPAIFKAIRTVFLG